MDVFDIKERERIIELGRLAAYEKKSLSDNPYARLSIQREAWMAGWFQVVNILQEEEVFMSVRKRATVESHRYT